MKRIVLRRRVYGEYKSRLLSMLSKEVRELAMDLDIQNMKITNDIRGHVVIRFEGSDEEFLTNLISEEYGAGLDIGNIYPTQEYDGQMVDVGKVGYGIYVNVGVVSPKAVDVLVPLYKLRNQTGLHKGSVKSICGVIGFTDNFPVKVRINETDPNGLTIGGEIADEFLLMIEKWIADCHERLLIFGANRVMIDDVLRRTGHQSDILHVEELGPYERSLVCKRNTRASGILAAVGPLLRGVPMHVFIPKEVEARYSFKT